jgi:hypothetical protein
MRGGTLLAFIQEKPGSIAGHGAEGERGGLGGDLMLKRACVVRGFIPVGLRSGPSISSTMRIYRVYDCCAAERG